jgi:hypothetical protein
MTTRPASRPTRSPADAHPARVLRAGLLGGALLLLLTGCTVGGELIPADALPTEGTVEAASLAVGDCVNAVGGDILAGLDAVPCSEPHDWEAYSELSVTGGAEGAGVPATDAAVAAAEEGCGAAFLPFLGLSPTDTSSLGYTYLISEDETGIGPGDRTVHCLLGDLAGPVAGSLAGAAR